MTMPCCDHGTGDARSTTVVGLLERPLYAPGLILEDSDLTAGVEYTRSLSRLLFRSLFGCGVVCGLTVTVSEECGLQVTVAPGLALDGCGDPVQVPRPAVLKLDKRDRVLPSADRSEPPGVRDFWVVLCGGEKRCAPRQLVCDADEIEGGAQQTRARAQAVVSLAFERPRCLCECQSVDGSPNADGYARLADGLLPRGTNGQGAVPARELDCQKRHNEAIECPADCGCDSACGCDCCVLLAWVHWFDEEKAWGVLHKGVRRPIRIELRPDPIVDQRPPGAAPPAVRDTTRKDNDGAAKPDEKRPDTPGKPNA